MHAVMKNQHNLQLYFIILYSGIQTIETGIGYSMSNTIQECATFLSAFVIAFSVSWEASLVTYSILPVSFIALYIAQKVNWTKKATTL